MTTRVLARVLAIACFAVFLGRTFHKGWNIDESDFPNYYTAAVLVRHGEPLIEYYDWAWFQRQMNFAGIEDPLGTYIPQTPLTMVPLLPMAGYPAQTAKRIWLSVNLGLLIGGVWLLSRITGFRIEQVALVLFAGYGTLQSNIHLGQYYILLFFLLTLAMWYLQEKQSAAAGAICGAVFALKLYGAPFLLYFVAKRNWKGVVGMIGAVLLAGGIATGMFGWHDVHYFLREILPRAIDGEGMGNPYHPADGTVVALLRRLFLREPELNPYPPWDVPWMFFFLRPFVTLAILVFTTVSVALRGTELDLRGFAWFTIATLCVSPNLGSYAFLLFLPPILVLMKDFGRQGRFVLVITYALLGFPLRLEWTAAFPKLWIFLALFLWVGFSHWRLLRPKLAVALAVGVALVASLDAWRHMASYASEPGRRFPEVMLGQGPTTNFTSAFAVSRAGIFSQVIADGHYVVVWLHDGKSEKLSFAGEAFHPASVTPDGPVYFELVAHGISASMGFDPASRTAWPTAMPELLGRTDHVVSPDGNWVAFETKAAIGQHIWLRKNGNDRAELLAGGKCVNASPTWELDSKAILFTSDCQRGMGLPALYRAKVESE
jgi:hypothetical protein